MQELLCFGVLSRTLSPKKEDSKDKEKNNSISKET